MGQQFMILPNPLLGFFAGMLSILSPCVLPLLPVVFGGAAAQHRLAPATLAFELAISFTFAGLFVATIGFSVGIDGDAVRKAGGAALAFVGVVLMTPNFQERLAYLALPISSLAPSRVHRTTGAGALNQAGLGLLLGIVWSPCIGPTLGAAYLFAAQGRNLGDVALVMLAFGLGAASILTAFGFASAQLLRSSRRRLRAAGVNERQLLGGGLAFFGIVVVLGLDRTFETFLVARSPAWLTSLTTRY